MILNRYAKQVKFIASPFAFLFDTLSFILEPGIKNHIYAIQTLFSFHCTMVSSLELEKKKK